MCLLQCVTQILQCLRSYYNVTSQTAISIPPHIYQTWLVNFTETAFWQRIKTINNIYNNIHVNAAEDKNRLKETWEAQTAENTSSLNNKLFLRPCQNVQKIPPSPLLSSTMKRLQWRSSWSSSPSANKPRKSRKPSNYKFHDILELETIRRFLIRLNYRKSIHLYWNSLSKGLPIINGKSWTGLQAY